MGAKDIIHVIRRPVITEKAAVAQQNNNAHVFEVDRKATKLQIKKAVEQFYSVKVKSVHTMIMPRKSKRFGRQVGMVPRWKKAIVTLVAGQSIQIVEGQ
jgi:large subunit ribosomal protein L23